MADTSQDIDIEIQKDVVIQRIIYDKNVDFFQKVCRKYFLLGQQFQKNKQEVSMKSEEIRQEIIDAVQTKTAELVEAVKAEAAATMPLPVQPPLPDGSVVVPAPGETAPAEEMVPKAMALQMAVDARASGYAEGLGAGAENENKRVIPLVQASIDSDRATDDELVAKLGLAPKA